MMGMPAKRIKTAGTNALRQLLVPAGNLLVSLLVVRLAAPELWGSFVKILVWITLASQIAMWGSKEFLLRHFSKAPAQVTEWWQNNLVSRLPVALLTTLLLIFLIPSPYLLFALVWYFFLFFTHSFEVLIIYQRKFVATIFIESLGFGLLLAGIFASGSNLNLWYLLIGFTIIQGLKCLLYAWLFRHFIIKHWHWKFGKTHLFGTVSFFLLAITGLLQSRTDLYIVTILLPEEPTAFYQVWISMMLYLQASAQFIILPYVKNIYRLPLSGLKKVRRWLAGFGTVIIPAGLGMAWLIAKYAFGFALDWTILIWSGLIAIPVFLYLPLIYCCYRCNGERQMLGLNLVALLANAALSLWWINIYGINGALAASATSQWVIFFTLQILWNAQWQPQIAVPAMQKNA